MIKSLFVVASAALLLAACGASDEAAPAADAAAAAPAAGETAEAVQAVTFTLANTTAHTLTHLYISPAAANTWDKDILGEQVLAAGESGQVTIDDGVESCMYDFRADFDDGDAIDVRGVDICKLEGETVTISG
jgi:hypothetical protein